jgi:thiamine kinase-like enzyme
VADIPRKNNFDILRLVLAFSVCLAHSFIMMQKSPPEEIIQRFCPDSSSMEISTPGEGNINDTFLVRTAEKVIVLQRINDTVFPDPNILTRNLQHLTQHLTSHPNIAEQHWEDAVLIPARDGSPSVRDSKGAVWRALSYIKNSICYSLAETALQAEQTGWALGHFHKRLIGLDVEKMQVPIPGFHNLENYLKQYAQLNTKHIETTSSDVAFCLQVIRNHRESALILEKTYSAQKGLPRIIHGDPKIANVLFDKRNGLAISLIDLDTVGPGLLQHDIGDCLRSVCNKGGEERRIDEVTFDLGLCERTLAGYFKATGAFLTHWERNLIYDGTKAITYELGLRFFMDYLQGGIYFKCNKPEDTLEKALVQFSLLQDIIAKEDTIRSLSLSHAILRG